MDTVENSNKIRKFKLIDKQGYLRYSVYREGKLKRYFVEGLFLQGIINGDGDLVNEKGDLLIVKGQLQFFEEVTPTTPDNLTAQDSLLWEQGSPLKAGLIVGKNFAGEDKYFLKYVGDTFVVLADSKGEETTTQIDNLRSLIKSDKEETFSEVLSAWRGQSLDNAFDGEGSLVHLGSFFDTMYTVMKGKS